MRTHCTVALLFAFITNQSLSGQEWIQQNSNTTKSLWGVYFVNQHVGYACGDSGTILKTTNGGTDWVSQNTGTYADFGGIQFIDANHGYVIDFSDAGGILFKTQNGGSLWSDISLNVPGARCGGCWFFSADTGYLAAGSAAYTDSKILRTVNGGLTWDTLYEGGLGWISYLCCPDRNHCYATMSQGRIVYTHDGGANWTVKHIGDQLWMSGIYFFDNEVGFAGGGDFTAGTGSIFKTENGGETWITEPTNYGTAIIQFVSDQVGYGIGANSGWSIKKIIKSVDGGASWADETIPVLASMNGIMFINNAIGYAVGDKGTILKLTPPIGLPENSSADNKVHIFINPSDSKLTIESPGQVLLQYELELINISGQTILCRQINGQSKKTIVDVSQVKSGIYIARLIGSSKTCYNEILSITNSH